MNSTYSVWKVGTQYSVMHTNFSRGRSGGLVFPSLAE